MGQERVLLADDLGRDLDDRAGALIETLDEPIGVVEAIGQIVLAVLVAGALAFPSIS